MIGVCQERNRHQQWLWFLRHIDAMTPADKELHLIVDDASTHKHVKVQRWLKRHQRFRFHFPPTSWSKAVESYIEKHNEKPTPFIWTAKASDILAKVKRARINVQRV